MATQYRGTTLEKPVQEFFQGDATLTIDTGGKSGNLAMNFPHFYNIGFKFNVYNRRILTVMDRCPPSRITATPPAFNSLKI